MTSIEIDGASRPACLRLSGALTIADCAIARSDLLQLFTSLPDGPLVWDLAELDEIDGAGVQLLLSTRRTLAARGHDVTVRGCGAGIEAIAQALGAADAASAFGAPRQPQGVSA